MKRALVLPLAALLAGCSGASTVATIGGRNLSTLFSTPRPVNNRITHPARSDARLAVLWVGHATVLIQMDDRFILTDPVFTSTVGMLSRRLVEPGLDPGDLPPVDAVLISHLHFDHFSLGSLSMIEGKVRRLFLPAGGRAYLPRFDFASGELRPYQSFEDRGLRVTAVPVEHVGWRYGADRDWMTRSFTGYVIEYHGMTVYYGGDTAFREELFAGAARRFPSIDLALLPIAPLEPRSFMAHTHEDPDEALRAFLLLGARRMVPVHYDTFVNSLDEPGDAKRALLGAMKARGLGEGAVTPIGIGEQLTVIAR